MIPTQPDSDHVDGNPEPGDDTESMSLGADPWLRFDLWAGRAWEASISAVAIAGQGDAAFSPEGVPDTRIITLFHAAAVAKNFAEAVNPLASVQNPEHNTCDRGSDASDIGLSVVFGDED